MRIYIISLVALLCISTCLAQETMNTTLRFCNVNPYDARIWLNLTYPGTTTVYRTPPVAYHQCVSIVVPEGNDIRGTIHNAINDTLLDTTQINGLCPQNSSTLNTILVMRRTQGQPLTFKADFPTRSPNPCSVEPSKVRHFYGNYVAYPADVNETSANFYVEDTNLSGAPITLNHAALTDNPSFGLGHSTVSFRDGRGQILAAERVNNDESRLAGGGAYLLLVGSRTDLSYPVSIMLIPADMQYNSGNIFSPSTLAITLLVALATSIAFLF